MPSSDDLRERELSRLLVRALPELERLRERYGLSQEQAAEVAYESFKALGYKWDEIDSPESWLLATVEARFRRLAGEPGEEEPHE